MEASIFHSFLSSLVTQYQTFSFKQTTAVVGERKRKEKKKEEEEEEEEGKCQVTNGDRESERESHLCEAKRFCNSVGD